LACRDSWSTPVAFPAPSRASTFPSARSYRLQTSANRLLSSQAVLALARLILQASNHGFRPEGSSSSNPPRRWRWSPNGSRINCRSSRLSQAVGLEYTTSSHYSFALTVSVIQDRVRPPSNSNPATKLSAPEALASRRIKRTTLRYLRRFAARRGFEI
jgi:hypothetical protein